MSNLKEGHTHTQTLPNLTEQCTKISANQFGNTCHVTEFCCQFIVTTLFFVMKCKLFTFLYNFASIVSTQLPNY